MGSDMHWDSIWQMESEYYKYKGALRKIFIMIGSRMENAPEEFEHPADNSGHMLKDIFQIVEAAIDVNDAADV